MHTGYQANYGASPAADSNCFYGGAGSDKHNPACGNVPVIFSDNDGPGGEFFPEAGLAVLDHIQPIEKNPVTSPGTVGLTRYDVEVCIHFVNG